jgi:hypothetical protein
MAEAATQIGTAGRPTEGQAFLRARVDRVVSETFNARTWYVHTMTRPQPDPYSMPAIVEVRARARLATMGEEWQGLVEIGGFPRKPFVVKDRDTGETRQVHPVQIVLTAVE